MNMAAGRHLKSAVGFPKRTAAHFYEADRIKSGSGPKPIARAKADGVKRKTRAYPKPR